MDEKNSDQSIRCPYCLASNPITASVCEICGKSLTEAPQNSSAGIYSKDNNNVKFEGDISTTLTGLLLLGIGTGIAWIPFAWIPYVQYVIIGITLNIAYFTITYGLQDEKGKLLLLIGLVSNFIIEIIIGAILYSFMTTFINGMFYNNTFHESKLSSFSGDLSSYSILSVIPMITYAIAYLRIRSVIQKEDNEGGSAANPA